MFINQYVSTIFILRNHELDAIFHVNPNANVLTRIVLNGIVNVLTQAMNDAERKSCCNV